MKYNNILLIITRNVIIMDQGGGLAYIGCAHPRIESIRVILPLYEVKNLADNEFVVDEMVDLVHILRTGAL